MPRRSNNSRRGPTQNQVVKRPKFNLRAPQSDQSVSGTRKAIFIIKLAESCGNLVALSCCKLGLVPFYHHRVYRVSPFFWRVILRGIFALLLVTAVHRFVLVIQRLLSNGSDAIMFLMWNNLNANIAGVCVYTSLIFHPQETVDVMNCFNAHAAFGVESSKSLLQNPSMSLKISMVVNMCSSIPLVVAGITVLWDETGYYRMLFESCMSNKLMAFCLGLAMEFFTAAYHMTLATLSASILLTGIFVSKTFTGKLRAMDASTIERREKVEELYIRGQVFNQIFGTWAKKQLPLILLGISYCIVMLLYATIRHTEFPWYIYMVFPYVGITLLILLFVVSYDIVLMTQSSEAVLLNLQSTAHASLLGLPLCEKRNMLKRAKACKPYVLQLSSFTAYSLMIPIVIWEEIVNQLLFLLTF